MNQATYSQFIASLELSNVVLSELTAHAKSADFGQATLQVKSKFSVACLERQAEGFVAEARLELEFLQDNDKVGAIVCAYGLKYRSEVALTDELFEEFSKINIAVNAWPFLREVVMTTTQRFGWTGFVLPPYKVPFTTALAANQDVKKTTRARAKKST
jgi:hypothetical protein